MKMLSVQDTKRFSRFLFVALAISLTQTTHAASGLISGHYRFQVPYSPVCLNGVYPFTMGKHTDGCMLAINTDPAGNVSGTIDLRTLKTPATGTLILQNNALTLHLQTAATGGGALLATNVQMTLSGNQFVGTATTTSGSEPCTLDISTVEPLIVTFDLTISVKKGKITGTGTASACGVEVPVTAKGKNHKKTRKNPASSNLTLTGVGVAGFNWQGSGPSTLNGFVAAWSAHGLGVIRSGTGLNIAPN